MVGTDCVAFLPKISSSLPAVKKVEVILSYEGDAKQLTVILGTFFLKLEQSVIPEDSIVVIDLFMEMTPCLQS